MRINKGGYQPRILLLVYE